MFILLPVLATVASQAAAVTGTIIAATGTVGTIIAAGTTTTTLNVGIITEATKAVTNED